MEDELIKKDENISEELETELEEAGTEEEGLLRVASKYSIQLSGYQLKVLIFIDYVADVIEKKGFIDEAERLRNMKRRYLELKQYNRSDMYIVKILEYISLKNFLGENAIKVNIEKK